MQFGKSLVGALVGGAVGIAALIGTHMLTGWDKAWLAIPVALITGLGVRWAADTRGHASYARGALTALVAILAFLAWYPIQAKITVGTASIAKPIVSDRVAAASTERRAATDEAATDDADDAAADGSDETAQSTGEDADEANEPATDDADEPAEPAANDAEQSAEGEPSRALAAPPRPRAQQFSTWDFLWLCVAGLIAYELGRGTAAPTHATGAMGSPDDGPPPVTAG
jgi:hypothetical protein